MGHGEGLDFNARRAKALAALVFADKHGRGQVAWPHGKAHAVHEPFKRVAAPVRNVDVHGPAALVQGREKRQALNMIPVRVGQNQTAGPFFRQAHAQSSDSGSGVHNENVSVFRTKFNAGGIAPVAGTVRR